MRILLIAITSFILSLNILNAQLITTQVDVNETKKLEETFAAVDNEILIIKNFFEQAIVREKKIYEFRIKFSNLITNVATQNTYKNEFQKSRKELESLEKEAGIWFDEASVKKDKINDLFVVVGQSRDSLLDNISKQEFQNNDSLKLLSKKVKRQLTDLKSYRDHIMKHFLFLDEFKKDIEKWKKFLVQKIKKSLDRNLLKWELSPVITNPQEIRGALLRDKDKYASSLNIKSIGEFYRSNASSLLGRIFLSLSIALLIWFGIGKLKIWLSHIRPNLLDKSFHEVLLLIVEHQRILSISPFVLFTVRDIGFLSIEHYSPLIGFFVTSIGFGGVWLFFGFHAISIFVNEMNRSKKRKVFKFRRIPVLLFIITKTFQTYFELESDILQLFNSILLGWISLKFTLLCLRFRIYTSRYESENVAVFLTSTKLFLAFFSGAVLLSTFLDIIGFGNLGSSIQNVVLNNLLLLAFGWILYQSLSYVLMSKQKVILRESYHHTKREIFNFIKRGLNVFFLVAFLVLVLESWYNTIFIFGDFWNVSILNLGDFRFTMAMPVKLIAAYYILKFIYLTIVFSIETFALKKLDISQKYAPNIISISRYFFIILYFSLGATIIGVTYKNLIIFASALGVGIGFGLQNIVNNFISGVILLFEQPIRVGDVIEVNGFFSTVKHIGIRSTIVESLDNSSIIIPNSEILSNKLTNWTLNSSVIAIKCEVGVAYGTDTKLVEEILLEVANSHERVTNFPKPQIWFNQFGDSSLNFVVKVWIDRPLDRYVIHSDILHEINKKFLEHKITIPFPQRDVHFYNHEKKVEI